MKEPLWQHGRTSPRSTPMISSMLSSGLHWAWKKKDAVMSEQRRRLVAYHEAGHAILGALVNDYDAVAKISIVPRGPAGGVTIFMPSEERLNSGEVRHVMSSGPFWSRSDLVYSLQFFHGSAQFHWCADQLTGEIPT